MNHAIKNASWGCKIQSSCSVMVQWRKIRYFVDNSFKKKMLLVVENDKESCALSHSKMKINSKLTNTRHHFIIKKMLEVYLMPTISRGCFFRNKIVPPQYRIWSAFFKFWGPRGCSNFRLATLSFICEVFCRRSLRYLNIVGRAVA